METPDELQTGWSLSINRAWVTLQRDTHTHTGSTLSNCYYTHYLSFINHQATGSRHKI